MSKIRITSGELSEMLGDTRMNARTKEIARQVFVEGMSHTEAAALHRLKRQRITQIVNQVEALLAGKNINVAVVREFAFSEGLSDSLKELEAALKIEHTQEIRRLAIARVKRAVDSSVSMLDENADREKMNIKEPGD